MVWHVLKKDWKLMWRPAAAVAGLQAAYAFTRLNSEFGGGNPVLDQFSMLLVMLWLVASVILIVMLVHQDALPGTKQDWLTRPIRRNDVLIAKLLFATLAVQGAVIFGDLIQGMGSGFPWRQTLTAALARATLAFISITLPALALGALTQSIADAMIMSVVLIGGGFLFTLMAIGFGGGYKHQFDPTNTTGVEWLTNALRFGLIVLGSVVVMMEQYRSRKTLRGRVVMGIVWLVVLCSQIIPWSPVFAIQERLSPEPGAAGGISMTWPTHADVTTSSGGQSLSSSGVKAPVGSTNEEARLVLPLSVTGMPANTILKLDKAAVTLFDASGMSLFHGDGGDVEIRQERVAIGPITYYETVKLPAQTYQVNKGRTVRAGTTYSMTLFKLKTSYAIPALGGDQLMPGWGRCVTRMNGASTAIEMTCMQMGKGPTCATVFLEDPLEGARNQMNRSCNPNYSPYAGRPIPDAVAHFRLILPFRDIAGLTKFAVDGSRLDRARIVIRVYEPQDHFTREVTSPLVMMQDLETQ